MVWACTVEARKLEKAVLQTQTLRKKEHLHKSHRGWVSCFRELGSTRLGLTGVFVAVGCRAAYFLRPELTKPLHREHTHVERRKRFARRVDRELEGTV